MFWRVNNASFESGLVRISSSCSSVGVYVISIRQDFTLDLKWWYFNAMCLVCGETFVPVAIFIQDYLSSWTWHTNLGFFMRRVNNLFISTTIVIGGKTSSKAHDNAMYSASAVLRAIYVCNELRQYMGQFAYMMTISVRDITFSASLDSACFQPPAKYAST